jgi:hypothetical protein
MKPAVDLVLTWAVYRPFNLMVAAGVCSIPTVFLGLWLQRDWVVSTGFVLGYACVAWGIGTLLFVFAAWDWIDELNRPGL